MGDGRLSRVHLPTSAHYLPEIDMSTARDVGESDSICKGEDQSEA